MKKKLLVVGQSTCYGMDLRPPRGTSQREHREKNCFAGLLAQDLDMELTNLSYPKLPTRTITGKINAYLKTHLPDLIVVGVPQTTLREIYDPEQERLVSVLQKEYYFPDRVWHCDEAGVPVIYDTLYQKDAYLAYQKYITVESALRDYDNEVHELQSLLELTQVPFLLVQMAPVIPNKITQEGYTREENDLKKYRSLLSKVKDDCWLDYDEFNAVDAFKNYQKGRTGHILEDGHIDLKNLILAELVSRKFV